MSVGNFFNTENRALNLRTVDLTSASGDITYTARTGRATDDFIVDRVIRVTTTDGYDMTITLPDGVAYGQEVLVIFEVEADDETVDVSTTTGDNATTLDDAGGYSLLQWHGSTLGWAELANETT